MIMCSFGDLDDNPITKANMCVLMCVRHVILGHRDAWKEMARRFEKKP